MAEILGEPIATLTFLSAGEPPLSKGTSDAAIPVLSVSNDVAYAHRLSPGSLCLVAVGDNSTGGAARPLSELFGCFNSNDKPGTYAVLAEVWPQPNLQAGNALASDALLQSLAYPSPGVTLLLYSTSSIPLEQSVPPCAEVRLECCKEADGQTPVVFSRQASTAVVENSALAASSTPPSIAQTQRQGRPPIKSVSPSMRGRPPIAATPERTPQKHMATTPTSANTSRTSSKPRISAQLQAAISAIDGADSHDSRIKSIVELLAKRQLIGRHVLVGNFIALPVLGSKLVFTITHASPLIASVTDATSVVIGAGYQSAVGPPQYKYANAAAEAAAEQLGGGKDGVAYQAALQAAIAGEASLGTSYSDLGGCQEQISALKELVGIPLQAQEAFSVYHITAPRGVMLFGPPGTGKTALARAAATESGAALFVVNGPDIVSEYFGESETGLKAVFAAARSQAPSIIFIDEVDAIAPSRGSQTSQASSAGLSGRLVTTLLTELDALQGYAVVVLAATNRPDTVDPNLRRPGRFDREIEIDVPSPAHRKDILSRLVRRMHCDLSDSELAVIANAAHGFVGADLAALCSEAAMARLRQRISTGGKTGVCEEDFVAAEGLVRPSGLREVSLEAPNVSWADIGGLEDVKQQLREAVDWPFQSPDMLARLGADPPRGILLYGPPGCSKTMIARAVAAESGLNFFSVKGPELYNKYVGESEKALAALFKKARMSSPAVVFFDEIDGMVTSRQTDGQGGIDVSDRVLSQLLQELDGLQSRSKSKPVVVLAATNRPDSVDPALLRPGRFDRLLYVPPPDLPARKAIFDVHTRGMPLQPDADLEALSRLTEGFTGADIAAACQQAGFLAIQEDPDAQHIGNRHFAQAIQTTVPSVSALSQETLEIYEVFLRQCDTSES